jgi:hypothetical protein
MSELSDNMRAAASDAADDETPLLETVLLLDGAERIDELEKQVEAVTEHVLALI